MSARKSAPPKTVSVREFARLDGCDESLVRRAVKAKKLTANADGQIDPKLAGTGWRRRNRQKLNDGDRPADKPPRSRAKNQVEPASESTVSDEEAVKILDGILRGNDAEFLAGVLAGQFRTTQEAERIKENALAAKHLLAALREAGNLIDAEEVQRIFFEQGRSFRDSWLSWPTRIGPLLAADLDVDVDRVVEALTAHVQQQLEQLGEPEADFTQSR